MKYTTDEALQEIFKRKEEILLRQARRKVHKLACLSVLLLAALIAVIGNLPARVTEVETGTVYGAFLLSREAGGYVLVAVIAFSFGIVLTQLCLMRKRQEEDHAHKSERQEKGAS